MMMINGEEWTVAELPEEMRKWIRDNIDEIKSYHVMEMIKHRHMEIPMETERKDEWNGYIGK